MREPLANAHWKGAVSADMAAVSVRMTVHSCQLIARDAFVGMVFCHQCVFLIVLLSCVMVASNGA